jgi:hypothetical protein
MISGYDKALLGDGPNMLTKLNYEDWKCREGMKVALTALSLQSENGWTHNILNRSEELEACVVPTLSGVFSLPEPYWPRIACGMGI